MRILAAVCVALAVGGLAAAAPAPASAANPSPCINGPAEPSAPTPPAGVFQIWAYAVDAAGDWEFNDPSRGICGEYLAGFGPVLALGLPGASQAFVRFADQPFAGYQVVAQFAGPYPLGGSLYVAGGIGFWLCTVLGDYFVSPPPTLYAQAFAPSRAPVNQSPPNPPSPRLAAHRWRR